MPEAVSSALDLVASLERFYGPLPAPPSDPFRCYVWEALSTQTTPGRRDAAYAALLRIPALTADAMSRAPRAKLEAAVAQAGAYRDQRLQALLGGVDCFRRQPTLSETIRGPLRGARRAVAVLPRLGDASAHRLLLFGGNHCTLPIDLVTARLCVRLGLLSEDSRTSSPPIPRVRRAVERLLPRDPAAFRRTALYFRHHAMQTCTDEPHCGVCPLKDWCPGAREYTS